MILKDKIISLKKELLECASLVEKMIHSSMQGLLTKDTNLLNVIVNEYEPHVNAMELKIEEICISLIAQYQPKAKDLRSILMVLKMSNDLERMADHTVNISESALYLIGQPELKPLIDIPRMADISKKMLNDALRSFVDEDASLANDVCQRDNLVDNLHVQIIRELITYMIEQPDAVERAMHLIRIGNNIERIADLSTNIGEEVIFIAEGKVIKHHHEEIE